MKLIHLIYHKTLNSVIFGIAVMVMVGLYIAVGSGFSSIRAYFEMTDLEFFNAWPLKVLMGLLIVNLTVVTWTRIPFTPPRYGVWGIHSGIIILILGMATYYRHKVEGTTLIPVNRTVDHFYDSSERMLYVRVDGSSASGHSLPSLPRFKVYSAERGNADRLRGDDLKNIEPYVRVRDDNGGVRSEKLANAIGLKDLTLDVVGYWPYANIIDSFVEGQGDLTGVRVTLQSPHADMSAMGGSVQWVVGGDEATKTTMVGPAEVEHLNVSGKDEVDALVKAAREVHRLDVKAGAFTQTMFAEVGKTYSLGSSGYEITIENFNPAFPMFGTNEIVQVLTVLVKSPNQEFRRQLLSGKREKQTDFKLGVADAGPFGKRQKELLDKNLDIGYEFHDEFHLLPGEGSEKQLMLTVPGEKALTVICTSLSHDARVQKLESGSGEISIDVGGGHSLKAIVDRKEKLRRDQRVVEVPVTQRSRQGGESGAFQVILVRVKTGDWEKTIPVPYQQFANDGLQWTGGKLKLPEINRELQLQLGNTWIELPARITLDKFELVHYPGGDDRSTLQRDFKSTLTIADPQSGKSIHGMAYMNNPVYWDGGRWLFFQAAWDVDGQRWTILGVGNRPGMWTMTLGCLMVFVGLMYAFYVKPIIIARNKKKALETFERTNTSEKSVKKKRATGETPVLQR